MGLPRALGVRVAFGGLLTFDAGASFLVEVMRILLHLSAASTRTERVYASRRPPSGPMDGRVSAVRPRNGPYARSSALPPRLRPWPTAGRGADCRRVRGRRCRR